MNIIRRKSTIRNHKGKEFNAERESDYVYYGKVTAFSVFVEVTHELATYLI